MGKGNANYRKLLKLAWLIESMPAPGDKAFQKCDEGEKARMLMELAWKEMSGSTYTHQWWVENKDYM